MGFWKEFFNIESDNEEDNNLYYEIYTLCKNCGQKENYKILKGKNAEEELKEILCNTCNNKSLEKTELSLFATLVNDESEINNF